MHKDRSGGFTLIELMVVVVIIGILATLALVAFKGSSDKARYAGAKIMLKRLFEVLEEYYLARGCFPTDVSRNTPPPGLVPSYLDEWPLPSRDAFNSMYDYECHIYDGKVCVGVTYLGKDKEHSHDWNYGFANGNEGEILEIPNSDDLFIVVAKDVTQCP